MTQVKTASPTSLLYQFIDDELRNYLEPERRGTPKGEKIGFGVSKFNACLLTGLLNSPLKKISEEHKNLFSYGLLRKWRSEADFKEKADSLAADFAEYIISFIKKEIANELVSKKLASYNIGVDDIVPAKIDPAILGSTLYNAQVLYNLSKIVKRMTKDIVKKNKCSILYFLMTYRLFGEVQNIIRCAKGKKFISNMGIIAEDLIEYLEQIFDKKYVSKNDKKLAQVALMIILNYIGSTIKEG